MPSLHPRPLQLDGFTIAVTADRDHEEQLALLRGLGATCVHTPLVTTSLRTIDIELQNQIRNLVDRPPTIAVFVTRLGVKTFLDAADALGIGSEIRQLLSCIAVGARSSDIQAELQSWGIVGTLCPESASMIAMADLVSSRVRRGDRLLLCVDSGEERVIAEAARAAGAVIEEIELYTVSPNPYVDIADRLVRSICAGDLDALTFTTRPPVQALADRASKMGLHEQVQLRCKGNVSLFAKGPVAQFATTELGLGPSSTPDQSRVGSLVGLVSTSLEKRHVVIQFDDGELRLQGSRVWARDDKPIDLTSRERDVLAALAHDPGFVWSKQKLLSQVWQTSETSEHAVEVTVARLRKRLGSSSHWIKTIPKRGYSLAVRRV